MTPNQTPAHAPAWVLFTYVSFVSALVLLIGGIFLLPVDLWMRGFMFIGVFMLVQSCITMTKTQRDMHESSRMVNRVEDARTERLLMDAGRM